MKPFRSSPNTSCPAKNTECLNSRATSKQSRTSSITTSVPIAARNSAWKPRSAANWQYSSRSSAIRASSCRSSSGPLKRAESTSPTQMKTTLRNWFGEQACDAGKRGKPEPVETTDHQDRGGSGGIARCGLLRRSVEKLRQYFHLKLLDRALNALVVVPDQVTDGDYAARHRNSYPSTLVKFQGDRQKQDRRGEQASNSVDHELANPVGLSAAFLPPELAHPELREGEGHKDVDRVEHDQDTYPRMGLEENHHRGQAHREHAVLRDETLAQARKTTRHPAIDRHRRQHLWSADETGLGRDEQKRALGKERKSDDPGAEVQCADSPSGSQPFEKHCIERLAALRLDLLQQVGDQDAARDEGQRYGHVDHSALAGKRPRLAQDRQAVADRLDAGVGPRTHAVGAEEHYRQPEHPKRAETVMSLADSVAGYRGQLALASDQRVNHKNGMHYDEREENRQQCEHRFLHSAQVHPDHRQHYRDTCVHLEGRPLDWQETEDRVSAAGDRDRDRQDVIDDQSASGDQARVATEQLGRYQISAASGRKLVDCLTVRRGDYEYGQRHQERQENREVLMRAERYECFFRAVAGRA